MDENNKNDNLTKISNMKFNKLLILGNMQNVGYNTAKCLREVGIDVRLLISGAAHAMEFPNWDKDEEIKAQTLNAKNLRGLESWISSTNIWPDLTDKKPLRTKLFFWKNVLKLRKKIQNCDLVELHSFYQLYGPYLGKPYIIYEAGLIRNIVKFKSNFIRHLLRRTYEKAYLILYSNIDMHEIFEKLDFVDMQKCFFIPFALDEKYYVKTPSPEIRKKFVTEKEKLIFAPSIQYWESKGNYKIFQAYKKYLKDFPNSKLLVSDWGPDKEKARKLVNSLGIDNNVIFYPLVPKKEMIKLMSSADLVLDQFNLGAWGGLVLESWLCENPCLVYWNKDYVRKHYPTEPPVESVETVEEIYEIMVKYSRDGDLKKKIGQNCREWVILNHGYETVRSKYLRFLSREI